MKKKKKKKKKKERKENYMVFFVVPGEFVHDSRTNSKTIDIFLNRKIQKLIIRNDSYYVPFKWKFRLTLSVQSSFQ